MEYFLVQLQTQRFLGGVERIQLAICVIKIIS